MTGLIFNTLIVIYCRYSSDLQSAKSCVDQEREIRESLDKMGIDHSNALVIHDQAESGTNSDRDEFVRLQGLVDARQVAIVAVDDQARFSRSDNTFGFITDLVFSGGRFISTGEGIDTTQVGWELRVKVMELHNSTTIRELGRRVRRGQLGRVLGQLSAGDQCYGYESFLVNPDKAYDGRGPKPERGLRINEIEAKWIRKIFKLFNAGRSIRWIADEMTRQKAPKGNRRRSDRWRAKHVRKIISNNKYIGIWVWGTTRTIRNSKGKKKQIPVPKEHHIIVERLELRIIDDATWGIAQARLKQLKDFYGSKPGQKRRGKKIHHTELYPSSLLAGLVFCSQCGSRMWQQRSGERHYLGCPNRGTDEGCCKLTTLVPLEKAEQAVLDFFAKLLTSFPELLNNTLVAMRQRIAEISQRVPEQIKRDERQLNGLDTKISNLVDALADGRAQKKVVLDRLDEAEDEAEQLRKKIKDARELLAAPVEVPDNEWIEQQLDDLASVIKEGGYDVFLSLRKIVGQIEADHVLAPGKTRGYSRLRFSINGWQLLNEILQKSVSSNTLAVLLTDLGQDDLTEEFVIDLGGPTLMDQWAPKIVEMRKNKVKWTDIVKITGMDLNRVYRAHKRYLDAQNTVGEDSNKNESASPEPPGEAPEPDQDEAA